MRVRAKQYVPVSNKLLMRLIDSMPCADTLNAFGSLQTTEYAPESFRSVSLIRNT